MQITLRTQVTGNYQKVLARFDRDLFEQLVPPGPKADLLRFDGSHKGNIVHIQLSLAGLFKQDWISEITEEETQEDKAWFTDEGRQLPFFLKTWKHNHIVENHGEHAVIVDDIHFTTPFWIMDYLMYPVLYGQFAWRKPIYRRLFGSPS